VTLAKDELGVPKVALAPFICTALKVASLLNADPDTVDDAVKPFALVETVIVELCPGETPETVTGIVVPERLPGVTVAEELALYEYV
jgi:hypothetical protein